MNLAAHFPLFLDLMLKSATVLAFAALILRFRPRASAAHRHLVWTCVFAAILLQPVAAVIASRWKWPPMATEEIAVVKISVETPPAQSSVQAQILDSPKLDSAIRRPFISWRAATVGVWLTGVAGLLARRGFGALCLWRWRRRSRPLENDMAAALGRRMLREYRLGRVELRQSSSCKVPLAWGVVWPIVMLPAEISDWPESRIVGALRHELGHIRRHDCLTRLLSQIACAVYWPNPLVWIAARALHLSQERACDDLVLTAGVPAEEYAAQLVEAARHLGDRRLAALPAVAMAQTSTLETRIVAIMDHRQNRQAVRTAAKAAAATLLALTVVAGATARVCAAASAKAEEAQAQPQNSAPKGPLICIDCLVMEISPAARQALGLPLMQEIVIPGKTGSAPRRSYKAAVVDNDFKTLRGKLGKLKGKGIDQLCAPSFYMGANQLGEVSAYSEPRFGLMEIGVTLSVRPSLNEDGSIAVRLTPRIAEFLGFFRADTGKFDDGAAKNPNCPVFACSEVEASHAIRPGQTLFLTDLPCTLLENETPATDTRRAKTLAKLEPRDARNSRGQLWIFATARVEAGPKEKAVVEGAE
jgi:beta-lactamase regulating signal transducer with metallopeptidase domain